LLCQLWQLLIQLTKNRVCLYFFGRLFFKTKVKMFKKCYSCQYLHAVSWTKIACLVSTSLSCLRIWHICECTAMMHSCLLCTYCITIVYNQYFILCCLLIIIPNIHVPHQDMQDCGAVRAAHEKQNGGTLSTMKENQVKISHYYWKYRTIIWFSMLPLWWIKMNIILKQQQSAGCINNNQQYLFFVQSLSTSLSRFGSSPSIGLLRFYCFFAVLFCLLVLQQEHLQ